MKCPRRKMYVQIELGKTMEEFLPCLKEECAWWDTTLRRCAVYALGFEAFEIRKQLEDLVSKMPKWEQFGK